MSLYRKVIERIENGKSQDFFLDNNDPDALIVDEINHMTNEELLQRISDALSDRF